MFLENPMDEKFDNSISTNANIKTAFSAPNISPSDIFKILTDRFSEANQLKIKKGCRFFYNFRSKWT